MIITYPYKNLVFKDKKSKIILEKVRNFAKAQTPVLLIGDNGTGKKELAKIYHYTVYNNEDGFFHLNSSNLDEEIGYSILFGYKKGAFTGAEEDKEGILEDKKTIYFSSIEHLPFNLFSPILDLIETKEYYPLGGKSKKKYGGLLIFSSKLELSELKETLVDSFYFHMKPFIIKVPDLRERKDDIPELIKIKIKEMNKKTGKNKRISDSLLNFIMEYDFKGNIREMFNLLERGFIESGDRNIIDIKDVFIETEVIKTDEFIKNALDQMLTIEELNKRYIFEIYGKTGGNRKRMAEILGISVRSVYNHLKKYGIINGKN